MEAMPPWIRAVFVERARPTQHQSCGGSVVKYMLSAIKNVHIESHFSDFSKTHKILLNHVRTAYKRNMVCDLKINSTLQVYSGSSVVLAL